MLQQHIWHQTLAHMHIVLLCHAHVVCDHCLCMWMCAHFTPSLVFRSISTASLLWWNVVNTTVGHIQRDSALHRTCCQMDKGTRRVLVTVTKLTWETLYECTGSTPESPAVHCMKKKNSGWHFFGYDALVDRKSGVVTSGVTCFFKTIAEHVLKGDWLVGSFLPTKL